MSIKIINIIDYNEYSNSNPILDSERSDECIGFTVICILFFIYQQYLVRWESEFK